MSSPIKTYDPQRYTDRFIETGEPFSAHVKPEFERFFAVRIEDMIRLMKLPVPPARTTNHTLMYLTEGEATMTIGSEEHTVYANDCLFVPAGQVFAIGNVDVDSAKGFLCHMHDDFIVGQFAGRELLKRYDFLQVWGTPRVTLDAETSGFVRQLTERILHEYRTHGLAHPDVLQPYLLALLSEINRVYESRSPHRTGSAVTIANSFRELLFRHVGKLHRVSDYADALHISPNHLNKCVKTVTGKSPTKWIDEAIVLEAKVLLFQSSSSVGEIAAAVGLEDASYFSRLFRKYVGMSPQAFRKSQGVL